MISFTIGDSALLSFVAKDGNGNPVNLTGATFQTTVLGPLGASVIFPNSKHTADPDQINNPGKFTLNLLTTDTQQVAEGDNKDVFTQVTQGPSVITYRGLGILNVYSPNPGS